MHDPSLPCYTRREDVPRDLRPAAELAARGYRDLGRERARLLTGGQEVALYSTSEARQRRDGMWRRRGGPAAGGQDRTDVVELAAGRAAQPRAALRGACRVCGRDAVGLVEDVCPSCRRQRREAALSGTPAAWIEALMGQDFAILDTESTGLGRRDEIVEVGVIDATGATLLQTLVWPRSGSVPQAATRVHGLALRDLDGAPTWPEVLPELQSVLHGRRVLAWNAPFDERMVRQSSRIWRVRHGLPTFECAMRAYAVARGMANGRAKLARAAAEQGVLAGAQHHRSTDDARLTLAVLRSLAAGPG